MKYQVVKKQPNSKKCIVCGLENELGLKAAFYELDNGEVIGIFKPIEEHQSYPGRLHGGIASAILDETIGRAIKVNQTGIWGVTVELNIQYKNPVPLYEELRVIGRITRDTRRIFEGTGEILLPNGDVAVIAHGKYLKLSIDKIADYNKVHEEWEMNLSQKDPKEFEI